MNMLLRLAATGLFCAAGAAPVLAHPGHGAAVVAGHSHGDIVILAMAIAAGLCVAGIALISVRARR